MARSSHWPGTANRGHWELRAAVPADAQVNNVSHGPQGAYTEQDANEVWEPLAQSHC